MLPDLHIGFSRGRSGGLVFPSLSEFSTVYCDPHSKSCDEPHRSMAERSYPSPKVRGGGREELPHVRGHGWRLEGAPPPTRSGAAAERSNPTSKERWLCGRRRADRSHSTFKVRRGSCEEIPLIQGKEQQLCFAGAAMKRYPTSKVRETQVRR